MIESPQEQARREFIRLQARALMEALKRDTGRDFPALRDEQTQDVATEEAPDNG